MIAVRNENLVLKTNRTVPFKKVPTFLAESRSDLKPEDIQVVPVNEEIRITPQMLPFAEFLVKAALSLILPSVEPVEESQVFRVGRGGFIAGTNDRAVVLTYTRLTDTNKPEFMRGMWFLKPVTALAVATGIAEAVKNRDFTYQVDDSLMLVKAGNSRFFVNPARSLKFRPNETEWELLKSAFEICEMTGEFLGLGEVMGRIRVSPDGLVIAGATVRPLREKAFLLNKLI